MSIEELTYADVWKTLAKEDVSQYTQEKGKLTYLSWSRAWVILMKHYPHAEYVFHDWDGLPYRQLPDGTAEVVTSVKIGKLIRSMPLPVMDYKNNPVVNPTSKQVSDNRMRCLVKNIAMFGLGMGVYATLEPEDLEVDIEEGLPDEKNDVQPEDKKTPKKKAKEEKPEPKEEPEAEKPDEGWASQFVEMMTGLLDMHETEDSLNGYWTDLTNQQSITKLSSDFPEHYVELMAKMMVRYDSKESLTGFYKLNKEHIGRLKSKHAKQKGELDAQFKAVAESIETTEKK